MTTDTILETTVEHPDDDGVPVKHAPLRDAAEYALWAVGRAAILRLSHAGVRRFGQRLGSLAYRTLPWLRRRVLDNLALVFPDMPLAERRQLAERSFRHWAAYFLELVSLARFSREEILGLFDTSGWEVLEALERDHRGYFFTTGHFGSFEMPAFLLQVRKGGLHLVVRPMNNPLVERDLRRLRERFGTRVIYKRGAGRAMLDAFRQGARVGIVADQDPGRGRGLRLPFLGHPAWTSKTLAVLSLRTGAPVFHYRCVPTGEGRYLATAGAVIEPPASRGRDAVEELTRRYVASIEEDVREHPELWLWLHRRWRD